MDLKVRDLSVLERNDWLFKLINLKSLGKINNEYLLWKF